MAMRTVQLAAGFLLLATAGCEAFTPQPWERVVGVIAVEDLPSYSPISVPDSVRLGESFVATVTTLGSGNCTRAYGADVSHHGHVLEVVPYDQERRGSGICTLDLVAYSRPVTLRFDVAGEARVRIIARSLWPREEGTHETIVYVVP
jgi:hypothetical protein